MGSTFDKTSVKSGLREWSQFQTDLERILNVKVDVCLEKNIDPTIRDYITEVDKV